MHSLKSIAYSLATVFTLFPLSAVAQSVQPIPASIAIEDSLICYMRTPSGSIVDLRAICGNTDSRNSDRAAAAQPNISQYTNLGGLNIYSRGDGVPCFGLDSQGRVCAPSSN